MSSETPKSFSLDDDIEFTRKVRRKIVHQFINDDFSVDSDVKDDPKKLGALTNLLDSIDRTAIGVKRIQVDEGANDLARETNGFLAQLHANQFADPLRADSGRKKVREVDLGEDLIEPDEFMLSQEANAGQTNYDEFSEEFLESHPEYKD